MIAPDKPIVFVSCGQYTQEEKDLGLAVCRLIEEVRPDLTSFYAEEQSSPEGLSSVILGHLEKCSGFVCIMHERGTIVAPDNRSIVRGSVWIEQEIAIVSFLKERLGRDIQTLLFCRPDVGIEGIRKVLIFNPIRFKSSEDVLAALREKLPTLRFNRYAPYDLEPRVQRNNAQIRDHRHDYQLVVDIENTGDQRVTDFQLFLLFPKAFLDQGTTHGREVSEKSTETHLCLGVDAASGAPSGLYHGQRLRFPLKLNYFVTEDHHDDPVVMASEFHVELYSGNMKPKKRAFKMAEYHEF